MHIDHIAISFSLKRKKIKPNYYSITVKTDVNACKHQSKFEQQFILRSFWVKMLLVYNRPDHIPILSCTSQVR